MLVTKNGVYLVSRQGKVRSFQMISWAQITAQLDGRSQDNRAQTLPDM